eukprot:g37557.t1
MLMLESDLSVELEEHRPGSIREAGKLTFRVRTLQKWGRGMGAQKQIEGGGVGLGKGGVERVRNRKVVVFVANRAWMLYKAVSKPPLGRPDVEEATSGATDAIDHIDGYAGEPLSDVEGLFSALNG